MFFVFYLAKNPTIYLKYIRFYNFFDPINFSIKTFSEDIADKKPISQWFWKKKINPRINPK